MPSQDEQIDAKRNNGLSSKGIRPDIQQSAQPTIESNLDSIQNGNDPSDDGRSNDASFIDQANNEQQRNKSQQPLSHRQKQNPWNPGMSRISDQHFCPPESNLQPSHIRNQRIEAAVKAAKEAAQIGRIIRKANEESLEEIGINLNSIRSRQSEPQQPTHSKFTKASRNSNQPDSNGQATDEEEEYTNRQQRNNNQRDFNGDQNHSDDSNQREEESDDYNSEEEEIEEDEDEYSESEQNEETVRVPRDSSEFPFPLLHEMIEMDRRCYKETQSRVTIDLSQTRYDVIRDVCEDVLRWHIQKHSASRTDHNIQWVDGYVPEDEIRRMFPYQKINHFPGSQQLGKKNLLSENIARMRAMFPSNYDFAPRTWILPSQFDELFDHRNEALESDPDVTPYYIVKPEASSQGKGIFLTSRIDALETKQNYVVQEYIQNPLLIDGLKFDLRLYVLLKSIDPLKIFFYQEGLARFATVPYQPPNRHNKTDFMMHLTNYALNKKNPIFQQNQTISQDNMGHKRSFSSVMKHLYQEGYDVEKLMLEIKQIIIKTIIAPQPFMANLLKSLQPKNTNEEMCFEVLGFDIMIDDKLKPYLIEVNHAPSFWTDSPLDLHVKRNLIMDTLHLLRVSTLAKKRYFDRRVHQQIESRSYTYRKKRFGGNYAYSQQEPPESSGLIQLQDEAAAQELIEWQDANSGAFVRIYPSEDDPLHYDQFLEAAQHDPRTDLVDQSSEPFEDETLSHPSIDSRIPSPNVEHPKLYIIKNLRSPYTNSTSEQQKQPQIYQNHVNNQTPKPQRSNTIHEKTNDDQDDDDDNDTYERSRQQGSKSPHNQQYFKSDDIHPIILQPVKVKKNPASSLLPSLHGEPVKPSLLQSQPAGKPNNSNQVKSPENIWKQQQQQQQQQSPPKDPYQQIYKAKSNDFNNNPFQLNSQRQNLMPILQSVRQQHNPGQNPPQQNKDIGAYSNVPASGYLLKKKSDNVETKETNNSSQLSYTSQAHSQAMSERSQISDYASSHPVVTVQSMMRNKNINSPNLGIGAHVVGNNDRSINDPSSASYVRKHSEELSSRSNQVSRHHRSISLASSSPIKPVNSSSRKNPAASSHKSAAIQSSSSTDRQLPIIAKNAALFVPSNPSLIHQRSYLKPLQERPNKLEGIISSNLIALPLKDGNIFKEYSTNPTSRSKVASSSFVT